MMQMPYDGVLQLADNLIVLARKAQQQQRVEVPRLMPALQHRMQQKEELMKTQADANAWLPEAREAKLSPMDYMDRCNKFLAKLDTLGWKRSFHQSLFHAVSGSCCAPVRTPVRTPVLTPVSTGLHSSDLSVLLQDGEARNVRENARTAPRQE
jgi:hypothetical protein